VSDSRKRKRGKVRRSKANKGVKPNLHKTRSQFKKKHG
jgi:hypothetical protein